MFNKVIISLWAIALIGCVNTQDTDALIAEGEWQAVGERDGIRGLPSRSLRNLSELAKSAGTETVNVADYEAGYMSGVDKYCDVNNAYDIGLSGFQYLGVCENTLDGLRFRMQYQRGYEDFQSADQTF